MVARAAVDEGQVLGLWSREVVEHVWCIGFIKLSLDFHKSKKVSHNLLGYWILTQHKAMVATRCHGCKIQ